MANSKVILSLACHNKNKKGNKSPKTLHKKKKKKELIVWVTDVVFVDVVCEHKAYNPFEAGCTCTTVEYFPSGIFSVGCAKSGSTEVLNATLVPRAHAAPGQFVEKFHLGPFTSSAHLTIVALGVFAPTNETYMIEFDCSIDFGIHRNYCYHAFTPSGHASPALTAFIQQKAQKLGLNPDALQWDHTDQTNCPHI